MKKILKRAAAVALGAAILAAGTVNAFAQQQPAVKKDENVYLILNADGSLKEQIVSVWLQAPDGLRGVKDVSNLKDVQNVKSNLAPEKAGGALVWATDDTDVYYRGTGTATPPLDVSIDYTLDGKAVKAEDLIGKTGAVGIHIRLKNNLRQERALKGGTRTVYTPIAVALVMNLPTAVFSNVSAPNAMVLTEGTNQVVTMLAAPGLAENFSGLFGDKLNDVEDKLGGEFTVTAETSNFAFPMIMGGAASDFAKLGDIGSLTGTTDFLSGIGTLLSAVDMLGSGTKSLADIAALFKDQNVPFSVQIVEAADGITQLSDGIKQLSDAANLLEGKVNSELIPGINEAMDTKKELTDKLAAVEQLYRELNIPEVAEIQSELTALLSDVCDESSDATIKALTGKTFAQLTPAEKAAVTAARAKVKLDADAKIVRFMSGLNATKLVQLIVKLQDLQKGASEMLGGMDTLVKSLYNPDDDIDNPTSLATAILAFARGIDQLSTGFNGFEEKLLAGGGPGTADIRTALEVKDAMLEQAAAYKSYSGAPDNAACSVKFIIKVNEPEQTRQDDKTDETPAPAELSLWRRFVNWLKWLFD